MNFEHFLKSKFNFIVILLLGGLLSFSLPPYNNISFCFIIFPALLYLLKLNELNGPRKILYVVEKNGRNIQDILKKQQLGSDDKNKEN